MVRCVSFKCSTTSNFTFWCKMSSVVTDPFGEVKNTKTVQQEPIIRYTLSNGDISVQVITYGATITSIRTPDKNGKVDDVVLGFDDMKGYTSKINPYFGATVGRFANRIADGKFELNGKVYKLAMNAGTSHLHGGNVGFDKVNWNSFIEDDKVIFTYLSTDGEENYPGDLLSTVTFQLIGNKLIITYEAVASKPTIVNLTNHSYFNLAGHGAGSAGIYDHVISINADKMTVLDKNMTARGEILCVGGTNYDLRTPKKLGDAIKGLKENGFDFNYCLYKPCSPAAVTFASRAFHPGTGRYLEVHTDQPGVQFYTANFLENGVGKNSTTFEKHGAFCFETQNFPNSINVSSFPNAVLNPGEKYEHVAEYTFGVQK